MHYCNAMASHVQVHVYAKRRKRQALLHATDRWLCWCFVARVPLPVVLLIIHRWLSVCWFVGTWLVVKPSMTVCNSTLQLNDAGRASYIVGSTSPSLGGSDPSDVLAGGDVVSAYPRSCPLLVAVRSGQTVNMTLYSYGRDAAGSSWSSHAAAAGRESQSTSASAVRRQRFCPAHVFIGEGDSSLGAPLCPSGQQRTRHLYLSRDRIVTIHFSAQQRGTAASDATSTTAARRLYFILKLQGKCTVARVPFVCLFMPSVIAFVFSPPAAAAAAAAALCLDTASPALVTTKHCASESKWPNLSSWERFCNKV